MNKLRTPQEARDWLSYLGITIAQWARDHSFSEPLVREVLAGRKKCLRGQSHNIAVALGMLRVSTGISIWWIIVPGYGLALLLTRFCPALFTAIAFDSGGVASGPMATTFVLALSLGASRALGGNPATDAFGMIAMIAMAPLITIQMLGLIFKHMENKKKRLDQECLAQDKLDQEKLDQEQTLPGSVAPEQNDHARKDDTLKNDSQKKLTDTRE